MDIRSISIVVLGMLCFAPAVAVESLDEADMGDVNIFSGDVLSVLGAPAAGAVEMMENDVDMEAEPPIPQTVGEEAGISMALTALLIDINRPERDFTRDRNVAELVFPVIPLMVPDQTVVPGPGITGGQTSRTILPGEKDVTSSPVAATDLRGSGIHVLNNTRIEEVRREGVLLPHEEQYRSTPTNTIIRGIQVSADAVITGR